MKFLAFIIGLAVTAAANPASARIDPTPPPSGIVVHLFGQNSVMSNIMPNGAAAHGQSGASNAAAGGTADNYVEPSTGQIMHQLFVTGDPNAPVQPSTGRSGSPLSK